MAHLFVSEIWDRTVVVVFNVYGMSPQSSMKLALHIKTLYALCGDGVLATDRVVFKLINELYFNKYDYSVTDASQYDAKARAHAKISNRPIPTSTWRL